MAKWKKTRICIKYVLNMLWSEQCEIIATIPPSPPPIKTLMFVPKKASRSILKHTHILQWDTMILFSFYYFMFSLKIFLNWSTVVIQCCLSFCCTTTWISHKYTRVPSLSSLPPTPILHFLNFLLGIWITFTMEAKSPDIKHICSLAFYFFFFLKTFR